jgi:hypothetical protein
MGVALALSTVQAGRPRWLLFGLVVFATIGVRFAQTKKGRAQKISLVTALAAAGLLCAVTLLNLGQSTVEPKVAPTGPSLSGGGPVVAACGSLPDGSNVHGNWGPNREMYTMEKPADYPVLNSITNNPNLGDERVFVSVKRDGSKQSWCSGMTVTDGEVLLVRAYMENSASENLDANGVYDAQGVKLRFALPEQAASLNQIWGILNATNTNPKQIYGSVDVAANHPFRLDVVEGSARVEGNSSRMNVGGPGTGMALPEDQLFGAGTLLGYDVSNGVIPPTYAAALYVTFRLRVTFVTN